MTAWDLIPATIALGYTAFVVGLAVYEGIKRPPGATTTNWLWWYPAGSPLSDQWAIDYLVIQGYTRAGAVEELARRKAERDLLTMRRRLP